MSSPAPRTSPLESYPWAAFISYSSKDDDVCSWLHKGLESYRVPKPLIGRPGRHGPIGNRLGKILRDRTDFPAGNSINGIITERLHSSGSLIVLCSPDSAKSEYVNEEIRQYKLFHGAKDIFAVIVDGEPHAAGKPGHKPEEECLPKALIYGLDSSGNISDISEPNEILAADFREGKDGRENGLLKLIAGFLNVDLDELIQRQKQAETQRRRRAYFVATAMSVLALLALCAGGIALLERNLARKRQGEAEESQQKAVAEQKRAEAQSELALGRSLAVTAEALAKEEPDLQKQQLLSALVIEAIKRIPPEEAWSLAANVGVSLSQKVTFKSRREEETAQVKFVAGKHRLGIIGFATGLDLIDLDTGRVAHVDATKLGTHDHSAPNSAFEPGTSNERYILIDSLGAENYIVDSQTLKVTPLPEASFSMGISSDSQYVALVEHGVTSSDPSFLYLYKSPSFSEKKLAFPDVPLLTLRYLDSKLALLLGSGKLFLIRLPDTVKTLVFPPGLEPASVTSDGKAIFIAVTRLMESPSQETVPEGAYILPSGSPPGIYRMNFEDSKPTLMLRTLDGTSSYVSRNKSLLFVNTGSSLVTFDLLNREKTKTVSLEHGETCGGVYCNDLSFNDHWLAVVTKDGWRLVELDGQRSWFVPQNEPKTALLSLSGSIAILVGDEDFVVEKLDTQSIMARIAGRIEPENIGVSFEGDMFAFGIPGGAGVVRLDPLQLQNFLCSQPGRNLDQAAWSRYLGDEPRKPTCPSWK